MQRRSLFGLGLASAGGCIPRPPAPPGPGGPPRFAAREQSGPGGAGPSSTLPLRRGINLGNALDAPSEGAWGVVLSETHFAMIADAGLDHVRLPVRFSAHAAAEPPYALDPRFLERVDWAIAQATQRGLSIIVDLHHYEELMEQPAQHTARFLRIWAQLSERYREQPLSVVFELLNEPCKQLNPVLLNELVAKALPIVRATNPDRWVIVDSYSWAAVEYLKKLELPEDPRVAASFHMYQPILFTHQGAEWMGPEYQTEGVRFPGPPEQPLQPAGGPGQIDWVRSWISEYNTQPSATNPSGPAPVLRQFSLAAEYAATSGRPVYLGEFGVVDKADAESRTRFLRLTRELAEQHALPWAYWDDGGRFRALEVNSQRWVPEIQRGLFGPLPG